jgi:hypothetical protein
MQRLALCLRVSGVIAAAAFLQAAPEAPDTAPNALGVIDEFLRKAATSNPGYRTDLRPGGDPNKLPEGRFFARGAWLGPFTYRARTYRELSAAERAELLGDRRFREYLAAAAGAFRASAAAGADPPFAVIPPAEMLKPGPFIVTLPAPVPQ